MFIKIYYIYSKSNTFISHKPTKIIYHLTD